MRLAPAFLPPIEGKADMAVAAMSRVAWTYETSLFTGTLVPSQSLFTGTKENLFRYAQWMHCLKFAECSALCMHRNTLKVCLLLMTSNKACEGSCDV